MANRNGLEALSAELFVKLLSCLPRIHGRLVLSLVSKSLYMKTIPHIYDHWQFHEYDRSFKSLYYFLRTIVLNPDLASRVQKLDIRDWDKKRSDRAEYEEESDEEDETDEDETRRTMNGMRKPNVRKQLEPRKRQRTLWS